MLRGLFGRMAPSGGTGNESQTDVTAEEARTRAQAGALLLDVREPEEWRSGHAPGAQLIPLGELGTRAGQLPRDREIITVCRSGNRSRTAAGMLRRAGFTQVRNMTGGMVSWTRAGLPVER